MLYLDLVIKYSKYQRVQRCTVLYGPYPQFLPVQRIGDASPHLHKPQQVGSVVKHLDKTEQYVVSIRLFLDGQVSSWFPNNFPRRSRKPVPKLFLHYRHF